MSRTQALPPVRLKNLARLKDRTRPAQTECDSGEAQAREAPQCRVPRTDRTRLTPREGEILLLLSNGLSSAEIGEAIGISRRTVEIHRGNIHRKLKARSAAHAIRIGFDLGLLSLETPAGTSQETRPKRKAQLPVPA